MGRIEALAALVGSLTKGEKKSIRMHARQSSGEKDYVVLFDLISRGFTEAAELRRQFREARDPHAEKSESAARRTGREKDRPHRPGKNRKPKKRQIVKKLHLSDFPGVFVPITTYKQLATKALKSRMR